MAGPLVSHNLKRLTAKIIDRWGVTEVAKCCGVPRPQNAARWKQVGNIPLQYREHLLRMAEEDGIELSAIEVRYLKSARKVPNYDTLASAVRVSADV